MRDICGKALNKKVKDFMYTPSEGEFVEEDASLEEAIHQLLLGCHQSLLVTRKQVISGVLRLTDVFAVVVETMKECRING